ncbi:MAG TPA: glycosyltransferase 87 family protein [Caulobacteraceae bacterium]
MTELTSALTTRWTWIASRWVAAAVTTLIVVALTSLLWRRPHFGPDFLVFWTAAQLPIGAVYVFKVIPGHPLPLVYPPTFLLLLQAFSGISAAASYLIWVGASTFAFVAAAASVARRWAPLVMLAPPVVFAAVTGETSLLIGAALLGGLANLSSRPLLAGLLCGVALSLKPQAAFLLPVGLLAVGQWRALAATLATGAALCLAAAIAFGPSIWLTWLRILPAFMAFEANAKLETVALAPHATPWLRLALVAAGCGLTWWAFRRDDLAMRLIAVVGASMLAAPHAMAYDAAMMAPCALGLLLRRSWARIPAAAFCLGAATNPAALLAFVVLTGTGLLQRLDRVVPFPSLSLPSLKPRDEAR